jgi:hypothetical protein
MRPDISPITHGQDGALSGTDQATRNNVMMLLQQRHGESLDRDEDDEIAFEMAELERSEIAELERNAKLELNQIFFMRSNHQALEIEGDEPKPANELN